MLDFFPANQKSINSILFGLRDNQDGTAAFADMNKANRKKWIADVENPNGITLTFTAIDKGIIKDEEYPGQKRCDGMLVSDDHLYFIELKNERGNWIQKGITQLGSTIELFDIAHPKKKEQYKHRKAFICNKKHPHFHTIDNGKKIKFYRTYYFHLFIQAKIVIAL